jgi:hypothetical protein
MWSLCIFRKHSCVAMRFRVNVRCLWWSFFCILTIKYTFPDQALNHPVTTKGGNLYSTQALHENSLLLPSHSHASPPLLYSVWQTAKPTIFVLWYRGDKSLNYEKSDRIVIRTDAKTIQTPDDGEQARTTSTLTITNARHADAGNYTCTVSNAKSSSVTVFVSEQGESRVLDQLQTEIKWFF